MKRIFAFFCTLCAIITGSAKTLVVYYSYTGNARAIVTELTNHISADVLEIQPAEKGLNQAEDTTLQINVIVGSQTFEATLADTETGRAFAELLPMTVTMNELNGNEKYHYLTSSLPTDTYQPGTIQAGDLMLYGNNCVVLFYQTFNSTYSYTRIGAINDPTGLSAALGSGNVSVRFEKSELTSLTPDPQTDNTPCTKVMENGVLYLKHNGTTYNVQGQEIR